MLVFSNHFLGLLQRAGWLGSNAEIASLAQFHHWVSEQPKVETHVHMEAAVSPTFYLQGYHPDAWQASLPWDRAPFDSLRGFIRAWVDLSKSMRTPNDFERLAEAFVAQRVRDNIRYSEAYISPADYTFIRQRFAIAPEVLDFETVLRAYVRGLRRGLAENGGFEVRLIVDALWISTKEELRIVYETLKKIVQDPSCCDEQGQPYIVAVGLGGMETDQSHELQKEFFTQIKALGLKIDIHSGEGGDADLHKRSLTVLQPDRVAHGFSGWTEGFIFDCNLVMCPLSNLLLKTFDGLPHEHPVFACLQRRIPVCIGSDDPLLLGNSLALEYTFLHAIAGKGEDVFEFTQANARARVLAPQIFMRVSKYV